MSIQKLADNLYIAPQLTEADVQEAAKLGIHTTISPSSRPPSTPPMSPLSKTYSKAFPNPSSPTAVPAPAVHCSGAIIRCKTAQASPKSSLPHNKQASI